MTTYYPDLSSIEKITNNVAVKGIVVHHSVSGENTTLEDLHRWHVKDRGFSAIGYHVIIFKDGKVVQTRPFDKCGAHCEMPSGFGELDKRGVTKSWNHYGIGVCFIGDFRTDEVTQEQWQSFSNLCYHLFNTYNLSIGDITWHRKASGNRTECPGVKLIDKLENITLLPESVVHEPNTISTTLSDVPLEDLLTEAATRIREKRYE